MTLSIDLDTISMNYQPDLYGYRAEQSLNSDNKSKNSTIYDRVNDLIQTDSLNTLDDVIIPAGVELNIGYSVGEKTKDDGSTGDTTSPETTSDFVKINNDELRQANFKIANSYDEYLIFLQGEQVNAKGLDCYHIHWI